MDAAVAQRAALGGVGCEQQPLLIQELLAPELIGLEGYLMPE